MRFRNTLGLIGSVMVIAGGMSPMLRIPIIGNWNYWDIDTVLASIVFTFAAVGIVAAILKKLWLVNFTGWGILIVLLFTLVAVYFKVHDYFNFIPLKKLARIASGMVHYKWIGWTTIFCGSLIMIFFSGKQKNKA